MTEQTPAQTQTANKQVYLDEKGRAYTIERLACCAGLGKITQNVHILYQDNGSKAVIPFEAHATHSKLEASAQSQPSRREQNPNRSMAELADAMGFSNIPPKRHSMAQLADDLGI